MKSIVKLQHETERTITVKRHATLEELIAFEYGMPIEEVTKCEHGGFDGNGKEYKFTFEELKESIQEAGCYGFANNKDEIHVWIDSRCSPLEVIRLLAHERGHCIRPFYRDPMQEEEKAELYSLCAEFAFNVAKDLGITF